MPHRGRTTAILLATGAVVVVVLGVLNFWDIVWFFQSDSQRIQGKWKIVSSVKNGSAKTSIRPAYLIVKSDNKLGWSDVFTAVPYYRLYEDHHPGWIDIFGAEGDPFNVPTKRGIYRFKGNTLTLCIVQRQQKWQSSHKYPRLHSSRLTGHGP